MLNADSGDSCPFEELLSKIKSVANDPNKIIASQGVNKNAPEMKKQSIVIVN